MRQAGFPTVAHDGAKGHLAFTLVAKLPALALALAICVSGCSSRPSTVPISRPDSPAITDHVPGPRESVIAAEESSEFILASAESSGDAEDTSEEDGSPQTLSMPAFQVFDQSDLTQFESEAIASNPELLRLQQEAAAAWQRARYVDKLPDPTLGLNVFGNPIETAAGSQRGNISVTQMIPWLSRLDAQEQQACYEALTRQQKYRAARLRIVADVRSAWYRLYVLGKQIELNEANQRQLLSLIETATEQVRNGTATAGDVLLGTLEVSRLEEQLVDDRQMVTSTVAELNRLRNQPAETAIEIPQQISAGLPPWQHAELREMAVRQQPAIAAAQLTTQAASWGLEVTRRERRPDFSVGGSWYFIGDNRPSTPVVSVGDDAWSLGASVSVPLWHRDYDAMEQEATRKQFAAQAAVGDVIRAYDARLQDLLAQARAADETASFVPEHNSVAGPSDTGS